MSSTLAQAATAWFLGFFPLAEILIAVPAVLALGMPPVSAVGWTVLGNLTPVVGLVAADAWLRRSPRITSWLDQRRSPRIERLLNRHGPWVLFWGTPWAGVWAVTVTGIALGMSRKRLVLWSSLSVLVHAVVLAGGILWGWGWISGASQSMS
jgi:uncharacterized membrane protein